jgi:hypothetical protein
VRANFSKVSNFMHILYGNLLIFEKICPHIAITSITNDSITNDSITNDSITNDSIQKK